MLNGRGKGGISDSPYASVWVQIHTRGEGEEEGEGSDTLGGVTMVRTKLVCVILQY